MPETHSAAHTLDIASVLVAIGTFVQFLPSISALFTLVWMAIRIWETTTVRGWFGRKPLPLSERVQD